MSACVRLLTLRNAMQRCGTFLRANLAARDCPEGEKGEALSPVKPDSASSHRSSSRTRHSRASSRLRAAT